MNHYRTQQIYHHNDIIIRYVPVSMGKSPFSFFFFFFVFFSLFSEIYNITVETYFRLGRKMSTIFYSEYIYVFNSCITSYTLSTRVQPVSSSLVKANDEQDTISSDNLTSAVTMTSSYGSD